MKVKSESEVIQSYLTLSNPMDCSLPGSSIHGIFQARVLEWGAIAFSKVVSDSATPWSVVRVGNLHFNPHPQQHALGRAGLVLSDTVTTLLSGLFPFFGYTLQHAES